MQKRVRRDPPLSARATVAADLEARKRDRAKAANRGGEFFRAEQDARSYRHLARNARLFGR